MSIQILKVPTCRHLLTNGRRCKSPALTTSAYCYHHQRARVPRPRTITIGPAPALIPFRINPLGDRASILHALGLILNGISSGELPLRHASKMLSIVREADNQLARSAKSVS